MGMNVILAASLHRQPRDDLGREPGEPWRSTGIRSLCRRYLAGTAPRRPLPLPETNPLGLGFRRMMLGLVGAGVIAAGIGAGRLLRRGGGVADPPLHHVRRAQGDCGDGVAREKMRRLHRDARSKVRHGVAGRPFGGASNECSRSCVIHRSQRRHLRLEVASTRTTALPGVHVRLQERLLGVVRERIANAAPE